MMEKDTAILLKNITKHYPVVRGYRELFTHPLRKKMVTALDGVNLEVKKGHCFCLLGPNGAGKTTLIKVLSTLVLPNKGDAFVNGFHVEKEPQKVKASIGFAINEERSFYWRLTGRQNLEFFATLDNIPPSRVKSKVEEVLSLTNLEDFVDMRLNTYSTGMRQMMAFARALITGAQIIFVDEPTRSLDPQAAEKIRKFLREEMVERQKRTVFWATHNLIEAQQYGHELAIIQKGKIRLKGTVNGLTGDGKVSLQEVYKNVIEKN
jgi:ABC-2 type transport system ATP-binding protein